MIVYYVVKKGTKEGAGTVFVYKNDIYISFENFCVYVTVFNLCFLVIYA